MCPFYSVAVLFIMPIILSKKYPSSLLKFLLDSKDKVIVFSIWLACTAITLLPSPLIEFRYFLLPWLFLQFEIKPFGNELIAKGKEKDKYKDKDYNKVTRKSWITQFISSLYPSILGYIIVNIVTLYIFLYRPFDYQGEVSRFMW